MSAESGSGGPFKEPLGPAGVPAEPSGPAAAAAATAAATKAAATARLSFTAWLEDELSSRPDEDQLGKVPRNHLHEVKKVPWPLEKLLGFGLFLCLDILLHELSFTPLQAGRSLWRKRHGRGPKLTVTEQGDLVRLALLALNVVLIVVFFDDSYVYHYIRRESFLKLYVIFNMLEMFERWWRSIGVDLFNLLAASSQLELVIGFVVTLLYCFIHATMHLLRILLLNVAVNTSSSAVFLLIVTNNFGEIKSSVFKKYNEESLFPIVASDIVERFYLLMDIAFVTVQVNLVQRDGAAHHGDLFWWINLLVIIEVITDWVKFMLICKFSNMEASSLEAYKEVLMADILLCRSGKRGDVIGAMAESSASAAAAGKRGPRTDWKELKVPFRGIHSFSHALAKRIGFCGIPFSTLLIVQARSLLKAPCMPSGLLVHLGYLVIFLPVVLLLTLLLKVLLSAMLLGYTATRRGRIKKGFALFGKLKAL